MNYNPAMSTRAADYHEAINHLPNGAMLVFHDVTWREYEELLEDLGESTRFRFSYDRGRLEVVSPLTKHDKYARFIDRLLYVVGSELDLTVEAYGNATWRREALERGAEADACFYIANAERVMTKEDIDLESDPPPDLVVEVDITNESSSKFPVLAALQVPEIWRYDGTTVRVYARDGNSYIEVPQSGLIPALKPAMLSHALDISKTQGQTKAVAAFREEFRKSVQS